MKSSSSDHAHTSIPLISSSFADPCMDHSRALRSSVEHLPSDWNCKLGRPHQTWLRTVCWVRCRFSQHWFGNCLSSGTNSTGMEDTCRNGKVHWISHIMVMMTSNSAKIERHFQTWCHYYLLLVFLTTHFVFPELLRVCCGTPYWNPRHWQHMI